MAAPTESLTPDRADAPAGSPFDDLPQPHLELDPDAPHASDFYAYADLLTDAERDLLRRLRSYLASDVAPVVDEAWASDSFPMQLVDGFKALDLAGLPYGLSGWSDEPARRVFMGFVHAEIARVDASTNSFFGVHCGLAMGSIDACGTPEQRQRWLPPMARMETIGAFGLTEPHGGFRRRRRDGDHGPPRRRRVGHRRRQALDRQRHVRRRHRHLGGTSTDGASQVDRGFVVPTRHRRLHRHQDRGQAGAAHRAERRHRCSRAARAGGEPAPEVRDLPRRRCRAAPHPRRRRLGLPVGRLGGRVRGCR